MRKQSGWPTLLKVGLPVLVSLAVAIAYLVFTEALTGLSLIAVFLIDIPKPGLLRVRRHGFGPVASRLAGDKKTRSA